MVKGPIKEKAQQIVSLHLLHMKHVMNVHVKSCSSVETLEMD